MACTLLAQQWAKSYGAHVVALTVDHGLRAESRAEAEQVAAWMHQRGITHHILKPPLQHHTNNTQENARMRRYTALAEWCLAHDILHCLIAHHAGDQRETAALMTARGDTADGPSGMSALRSFLGVRFLRPLLHIEKAVLQAYLRTHAAPWIEDPSNQNTDFARVRVRQTLAGNPHTHAAQETVREEAAVARIARQEALAKTAADIVTLHPLGFAELPQARWLSLADPLASQLLADLLTTVSGAIHRPRRHETDRACAALREGEKRLTLHRCDITQRNGIIRIARELARCEASVTLSGSGSLVWDQRFHVHYAVPHGTGLTLKALGVHALPPAVRHLPAATPSLWHLDELLFVPHMYGCLPKTAQVYLGYTPPKPLAPAAFW